MKFENTDVWGFKHAISGMRNPLESWNKSDTRFDVPCYKHCPVGVTMGEVIECQEECGEDPNKCLDCKVSGSDIYPVVIGSEDMALMQKLIKAGSEHRKFMRQIFVSVDITAPMYWWSEFDTYKVGTVANSTSKMHKLASTPITMDCFEMDDFKETDIKRISQCFYDEKINIHTVFGTDYWKLQIQYLEQLRIRYNETKDKTYWKELIRVLPESWLQKRTVTMDYENILSMCGKGQRRFHKLNEWSGVDNPEKENFIKWARSLPYAKELIFLDETDEGDK